MQNNNKNAIKINLYSKSYIPYKKSNIEIYQYFFIKVGNHYYLFNVLFVSYNNNLN
jgi:hypothetical protein